MIAHAMAKARVRAPREGAAYLLAIAVAALVGLASVTLQQWTGDWTLLILSYPAIMLAAWAVGFGPALAMLGVLVLLWLSGVLWNHALALETSPVSMGAFGVLTIGSIILLRTRRWVVRTVPAQGDAPVSRNGAALHSPGQSNGLDDQQERRLNELVRERTAVLQQAFDRVRASDRIASIGTLASGIGHDLGNLVLPILCRLDALVEQPLPVSARREILAARDSIVHLRKLSSSLRMLSAEPVERGVVATTDLDVWWSQVEALIRRSMPRDLVLEVEWEPDLPPVGLAPHQLTQAVLNLLFNAAEALAGRGTVMLWSKPSQTASLIYIGVSDDGPGMSESVRSRAIDPFFTTKIRGLSTGLGLTQVHSICRSVGGSLEIDSSPRGTTVTMELPVGFDANTVQAPTVKPRRSTPLACVALQDDRVASYTKAILESSGFAVCRNGRHDASDEHALLITEPSCHSHPDVRRFLSKRRDRRVIMVGRPPDPMDESRIMVVEPTHRAMRDALQHAAGELSGHSMAGEKK